MKYFSQDTPSRRFSNWNWRLSLCRYFVSYSFYLIELSRPISRFLIPIMSCNSNIKNYFSPFYGRIYLYPSRCGPTRMILISAKFPGHRQAYKIRIIFSFRGLPANVTSSLIKTNSCLTQSYPAICEVLQAELCPQIISTPFNKAVMLIRPQQISWLFFERRAPNYDINVKYCA